MGLEGAGVILHDLSAPWILRGAGGRWSKPARSRAAEQQGGRLSCLWEGPVGGLHAQNRTGRRVPKDESWPAWALSNYSRLPCVPLELSFAADAHGRRDHTGYRAPGQRAEAPGFIEKPRCPRHTAEAPRLVSGRGSCCRSRGPMVHRHSLTHTRR